MITRRKIFLTIYLFVLIFQPPIIPYSLIYFIGLITIMLFAAQRGKISSRVAKMSGMSKLFKCFIFLSIYLLIVSAIDIVTGGELFLNNRLRCFNQLAVQSFIEFICISYVLEKYDEYSFSFDEVVWCVAYAGALQGLCSVFAYAIPSVRAFFLKYSSSIFSIAYVYERRGFGFSDILVDTYGYGMGLIAGLVLLYFQKHVFKRAIIIALCTVSIVLNSRTGLVIFAIAFILFLFKSNSNKWFILKSIIAVGVLFVMFNKFFPWLTNLLISSQSVNLNWVGNGFLSLSSILTGQSTFGNAVILSDFSHFPNDFLGLLFGTGHNIYGISDIIGFHSDVGYINYIWEFGIVGTVILFVNIALRYIEAFHYANYSEKFAIAFLVISYLAVLVKGILIGCNPGVVVNYSLLFGFVYMKKKDISEVWSESVNVYH